MRGEERLLADVYLPAGEGPFGGVLVVHGGAWTAGSKAQLSFVARRLADSGFTAVAINYRLAPKHPFPAQLEDCEAAVRWMRTNARQYQIDPQRIGGYGYSAGGHLVALLGAKSALAASQQDSVQDAASTSLQAVVAGGAPCDFRGIPRAVDLLAYWLGGTRAEVPEAYKLASPAQHVSKYAPPMFFFHGQDDRLVRPSDPQAMVDALKEQGVHAELKLLADRGHVLAMFDDAAIRDAVKFLQQHLHDPVRSGKKPTSGSDSAGKP
jgi:triacylglycerol lipase